MSVKKLFSFPKTFAAIPLFCLLFFEKKAAAQNPLYADSSVPSIFVELPVDSLQLFLDQKINWRYTLARFIFKSGAIIDTFENAGIRLRGNTSLSAQKRSFKLSFNEFVAGGRFRGVKKVNLRAEHNDPTMAREKLFYDISKKVGLPERRANFVRFYINNEYRGLYTNIEEMDDEWLERTYNEKDGNLYKCTYPANLKYLGGSQQTYKNIMNSPIDRAYDLQTNKTTDDYSDLVALLEALSVGTIADLPQKIEPILNVENVLKTFAVEVACGHWDNYFYNKNNYYLYHVQKTDLFEMISFDTDNTMGIDWLGIDWAERNCLKWQHPTDARPLATRLLAVPKYKDYFVRQLDTLARFIIHPDSLFSKIDAARNMLLPHATDDIFRTLDYGYSINDFKNGFEETVDNHSPYGIKPFFEIRRDSILAQIAPFLNTSNLETEPFCFKNTTFRIEPTSTNGPLNIFFDDSFFDEKKVADVIETNGRVHFFQLSKASENEFSISVDLLPSGFYYLKIGGQTVLFFRK